MENSTAPITIYGTHTCSDCARTKLFLTQRNIPFAILYIEDDQQALEKSLEINGNQTTTPTVVFPDGSWMVEPDNEQLSDKLKALQLL
jgi:glutaredoxin